MKSANPKTTILIILLLSIRSLNAQSIQNLAFTNDGKYIITSGWVAEENANRGIQLWDTKTAKRVKIIPVDADGIAVSPDDRFLAISNKNKVVIYSIPDGNVVKELIDPKCEDNTFAVKYMPDGKSIIAGQKDGYARMWNIETATMTKKFKIKSEGENCLAISPDGKKMVSGGEYDKFVKLWDIETGDEIKKFELPEEGKTDGVNSITFDSYGNEFATAGRSMPVRWSSSSKSMIRRYDDFEGTSDFIQYTAKDDGLWVCGYKDLFQTTLTRDHPYTSYAKQSDYIVDVAFSPNNNYFLTACGPVATLYDARNGLEKFVFDHFGADGEPGLILPYLKLANLPDTETWSTSITDTDAKYLQAVRRSDAGKYPEAKKLLEEYLTEAKGKIDGNYMPYYYLGLCYYMEKDYDNSLKQFMKDLEYDNSRSCYDIASLYLFKADTLNALKWLEQNLSSPWAYSRDVLRKDKDWAPLLTLPAFVPLMAVDKRPAFKKYVDSCDYYVGKADYEMAHKMIDEAIKAEPNNPKGYHGRGMIYMKQMQFSMAVHPFLKEMKLEEASDYKGVKTFNGHQQLAQTCWEFKSVGGSVHYTSVAIAGNKTFYRGYPDLASFMIRDGEYKNAVKVSLDYNRIAPEDDFGFYMTALAYSWAGDEVKKKEYAQKAIDVAKAAGNAVPADYEKMLNN